jgi:hypothetical protein
MSPPWWQYRYDDAQMLIAILNQSSLVTDEEAMAMTQEQQKYGDEFRQWRKD